MRSAIRVPLPLEDGYAGSDAALVRLAMALGALDVGGPLSEDEHALAVLASNEPEPSRGTVVRARDALHAGDDPLGTRFYQLRDATTRRAAGAIYTPARLVRAMVDWVLAEGPSRVVDPGSGSGRFSVAVARRDAALPLVAVDADRWRPCSRALPLLSLALSMPESCMLTTRLWNYRGQMAGPRSSGTHRMCGTTA